jgi:hypothetical protein
MQGILVYFSVTKLKLGLAGHRFDNDTPIEETVRT